ncbi:hypothetical protein [Aquisalimonas sp.]|uniref:hypothetical protein n=1 Tax=unclassified Aquisalimonas TaxID=2644645 RepID=UPI0025BC4141|nr:hypothetical protein [Aquisalimonas sp.]
MLDVYVYYPRGPNLSPPRQLGQVQQTLRYADDGVLPRDRTPGREAIEEWNRATRKSLSRGDVVDDDAPPDASGGGDDDRQGGDHIDTYA